MARFWTSFAAVETGGAVYDIAVRHALYEQRGGDGGHWRAGLGEHDDFGEQHQYELGDLDSVQRQSHGQFGNRRRAENGQFLLQHA